MAVRVLARVGVLALLLAVPPPTSRGEVANSLFEELHTKGVPVGNGSTARLPALSMPDGLDARAQREILETIASGKYSVEELARPAVVAPFVLKYRDLESADCEAPAYGIDLWFIAHGSSMPRVLTTRGMRRCAASTASW